MNRPDAFPAIVKQAKAQGALVAANPRVRQLSSRGGAFVESLAHIDILAVNRSEADVLVPAWSPALAKAARPWP
jgi:ribokinase